MLTKQDLKQLEDLFDKRIGIELDERLKPLEERLTKKIEDVDFRAEMRIHKLREEMYDLFELQDIKFSNRIESLRKEMNSRFDHMNNRIDEIFGISEEKDYQLDKRVEKLEQTVYT